MEKIDVPITIVGGGPNGLAMALALSRQGIASRVLEKKSTTTDHPKARGVWPRAMEIFRQWGVYDYIKDRGLPDESDSMVVLADLDHEIDRTRPEPYNDESPARKSIVAQDAVEEGLVLGLRDHPLAEIRWNTEFLRYEEVPEGVRVHVRDLRSGEELSWTSIYLIGADGGSDRFLHSIVEYDGPPVIATMLNTYFKVDLSRYPSARNAAGLQLPSREPGGEPINLLNTNGRDRWLWLQRIGGAADERPRPLTERETIAKIRDALRVPDLEVELINEAVWRLTRRIARSFRIGRLFLVGDAAHRFPPYGGFGMNSGIQDVHNLAWKLAFVMAGKASDALLDTYDEERRPIAHANADLALVNLQRYPHLNAAVQSGDRDRVRFWLHDAENHIHSIGHTLGFVYPTGALVPDHTTPPNKNPRFYTPTDRPGSRYPHLWLDRAVRRSTLDLFDRELVLMVGSDGAAWTKAAAAVSATLDVPIAVQQVPDGAGYDQGIAIGDRGAALVRPDGITAWRTGWIGDNPEAALSDAVSAILGRS